MATILYAQVYFIVEFHRTNNTEAGSRLLKLAAITTAGLYIYIYMSPQLVDLWFCMSAYLLVMLIISTRSWQPKYEEIGVI